MRPLRIAEIVVRLECIRDLSNDLARELLRDHGETPVAREMVDTIKREAGIVSDALNRPK
jgi:hypothetical protein